MARMGLKVPSLGGPNECEQSQNEMKKKKFKPPQVLEEKVEGR